MSAVREADYATYLELKRNARIKAEERRGDFVYYAVEDHRDVHFANPGPGEPISAWVTITERYKARIPQAQ